MTRCCWPRAARRGSRRSTGSTRTACSRSARSMTRASCCERAGPADKAVVIGGGLLGLEAARGLQVQGCHVTVVHLMHDADGAAARSRRRRGTCRSKIEELGVQRAARPHDHGDPRRRAGRRRRVRGRLDARGRPGRGRGRHPAERRAGAQGRPHRQSRHRRQRLAWRRRTRTSLPSASASSTTASATAWWRRSSSRARCWRRRSPGTRGRPIPGRCRPPSSRSWGSTSSRPANGRTGPASSRCGTRIARSASTRSSPLRDGKLAGVILVGDAVATAIATWSGCASVPI